MDLKEFEKDRDLALLSLDKNKILMHLKKYGIKPPTNEKVFWAGVHKAILCIKSATQEQKEFSQKWLKENGFKNMVIN